MCVDGTIPIVCICDKVYGREAIECPAESAGFEALLIRKRGNSVAFGVQDSIPFHREIVATAIGSDASLIKRVSLKIGEGIGGGSGIHGITGDQVVALIVKIDFPSSLGATCSPSDGGGRSSGIIEIEAAHRHTAHIGSKGGMTPAAKALRAAVGLHLEFVSGLGVQTGNHLTGGTGGGERPWVRLAKTGRSSDGDIIHQKIEIVGTIVVADGHIAGLSFIGAQVNRIMPPVTHSLGTTRMRRHQP